MTLHYEGLGIDCYNCGHRSAGTAQACEKCEKVFEFRVKPAQEWTGEAFYAWMYAYAFQLDEKVVAQGIEALPRIQQLHYLVGYFNTQVMNGGVGQYFFNPSGVTAPQLVQALKEIGARQLAAILEPIVAQFPQGQPPQTTEARAACMDAMGDEDMWEQLDEKVSALVDSEDSPEDLLALLYAGCAAQAQRESAG